MKHYTESEGFVQVVYYVATPDQHTMDVTCTVRGNPTALAATRVARRKLRYHNLKPLALIKVERIL